MINTAYVERLNATFRSRLAGLVRRGRCLVRQKPTLQAGMYLVGVVYNFCTYHDSLRQRRPNPAPTAYEERTPAMAAGLTNHCWSMGELLHYRLVPQWWPPLRRNGHPVKWKLPLRSAAAPRVTV